MRNVNNVNVGNSYTEDSAAYTHLDGHNPFSVLRALILGRLSLRPRMGGFFVFYRCNAGAPRRRWWNLLADYLVGPLCYLLCLRRRRPAFRAVA